MTDKRTETLKYKKNLPGEGEGGECRKRVFIQILQNNIFINNTISNKNKFPQNLNQIFYFYCNKLYFYQLKNFQTILKIQLYFLIYNDYILE
jgi:hypothetical protein